jgi:hypothetical protein
LLQKLEENQTNRELIFTRTLGQSSNPKWFHIRNSLLTASNFGWICKRRKLECSYLLKDLIDKQTNSIISACIYGLETKALARERVEMLRNITINDCDFMIDSTIPYIGCSSDGTIIYGKGIVKIKCPSSAKDMTILEATQKRK